MDAVREGLRAGLRRGDALPGACRAISSRCACWSCRSPTRARSIRSSATSWKAQIVHAIEDVVFDHLVVGQRPEGSTVLAAAAQRDDLAALIAAAEDRGIHPRSLFAAPVDLPRRCCRSPRTVEAAGADPLPGGARLRPPAHQRLLRARRRADLRAHHPARRRAADRRDRQGVQRRRRARRAGQARRRVPRQPGAAGDHAAERQAGHRAARGAGADRSASCARRWPASAPANRLRRRRAAGGGRRRPAGRSAAVPRGRAGDPGPLSFRPRRRWNRAASSSADVAGAEGAAPESDSYALAAAIALGGRAAARARSTSAAGRSSTAPASRSCARRRGTWPRWRRRCCSRAASTSAPGTRSLSAERKALDKELKTATQELFGKPRDDAEAITQLMKRGFREELAPVPKATAFDLLDQISRKVPPADKIKLDVAELEIRPKKTFIKGTVDYGGRRRRDGRQAEGDRLLRRRHQGGDHRGLGRRASSSPSPSEPKCP